MKCLEISVAVMAVALVAAACTASGAKAPRTTPPTSQAAPPNTGTSSTSATIAPSTSKPRRSKSNTATVISTPSVAPAAQGAVDAYVADYNEGISASRDPVDADLSWVARYESETVGKQTQDSFAYMKSHGLAYRGATPDPNVKVESVLSASSVVLTSCLAIDKDHPWMQYVVATGDPVASASPRNPPPPYLLRIYMKTTTQGSWQINNVLQDTSKTCKG